MTQIAAVETLSAGEERFERGRKFVGFIAAPIVFIVLLTTPMSELKPEAHRLAAVMATVIVLWLTEAIPMPATALLGAAACVVLKVAPAREVFAPFAETPSPPAAPLSAVGRKSSVMR